MVKLIERDKKSGKETTLGTFADEVAAQKKASELGLARHAGGTKLKDLPTYRIVPA